MYNIREARESDAPMIRELFIATYGKEYPYTQFYDLESLEKMIFVDNTLVLVAEEEESGSLVGIASVVMEIGAYTDLIGEFGRLAVHPKIRNKGIGKMLMKKRKERAQENLQVGIIEARAIHPYAQKIACTHGFSVVGFLPMKHLLNGRESVALFVDYFEDTLTLRKTQPCVIPEVHPISQLAFRNTNISQDVTVDESSPSYPYNNQFEIEEMTTEGYASLLRIERGRIRNREIFGPMRLHYGFFQLNIKNACYLLARDKDQIVGAIGFTYDPIGKSMRIFELISLDEQGIRFLFTQLEKKCKEWGIEYMEVDVSAYAPRMQRTLLELNYLPVAYIPAMAFHDVERLDIVKMARILVPFDLGQINLIPKVQEIAELVMRNFSHQNALPQIGRAAHKMPLLAGLNEEQIRRFTCLCQIENFNSGDTIFYENKERDQLYVLLNGKVAITMGKNSEIGEIKEGETFGELSLLAQDAHSATAIAKSSGEILTVDHNELAQLIRFRPDIGVVLYKNLAIGLGEKLRRASESQQTLMMDI